MQQTERTAIVLRAVNYRDSDRMLTLFSPVFGRIEAKARGCRKPKARLLAASEPFALGEYTLYEKNGRLTVTGATLTESFYSLREDYEKLTAGSYLLSLCESCIMPGQGNQALFMLLLHALANLAYRDQPIRPLMTGFFLRYSQILGFGPELETCHQCGRLIGEEEPLFFENGGGLCCRDCRTPLSHGLAREQLAFLRSVPRRKSSEWLDTPDCYSPYGLMRRYVEAELEKRPKAGRNMPQD